MIYPQQLVLHPPVHTQAETRKIISKLLNLDKTKPVLELGAGTGRLTIPLLQAGFKVDIVEPDIRSSKILLDTSDKLNLKNFKIYTSLPKRKYQAIVGSDILHHLDIRQYLPEIYRHLLPDGLICFSEPNGSNAVWYLMPQVLLFWELEKGITKITSSNISKILTNCGYKNIEIEGLWFNYRLIISAMRKKSLRKSLGQHLLS